jgi:hypothetical protein
MLSLSATPAPVAEGFNVAPGPLLFVWTAYVVAAVVALAACGAKGRWGWFLLAVLTLGVAGFVGATRPAVPGSPWTRLGRRRAGVARPSRREVR